MKVFCVVMIILGMGMRPESDSIMLDKAEKLAGDNIMFFKGNSGLIANGIYIRKKDSANKLYDNNGEIFSGKKRGMIEAVTITQKNGTFSIKRGNNEILEKEQGIIVVFGKDFVYLLDFNQKIYGKYPRKI